MNDLYVQGLKSVGQDFYATCKLATVSGLNFSNLEETRKKQNQ